MAEKSDSGMGRKNGLPQISTVHQANTPELGGSLQSGQDPEPLVSEAQQEGGSLLHSDEVVEAITSEFFHRIDALPRGTLARLQRTLKVGKNYFRGWRKASRVRLLLLAKALEFLKVDPAEFFSSAFVQKNSSATEPSPAEIDGRQQLESLAKSSEPPGVPPSGVRKVLERMNGEQINASYSRAMATMDRQELARLDALRWDNPREVNELLEQALDGSSMELLAEILLLYGATFRQLDRLDDARWAYFVGEMRAKEASDRGTLAKIFQWRSEVEFSDGNCSGSLELLRKASGIYSELGERNREATVLVHIAIQYIKREKFEEAITCAKSALRKLDIDEYWYRFSVHQALAGCSKALGDIDATLQHLEAARALLDHCPRSVAMRFVWLEATLKKEVLPLEEAASVFEEAAAFFVEIGEVLTGSLALLEFVNCLVALGNHQELSRVARVIKGFAFKLDNGKSSSRLSAAALMGVYRAILRGAISESLVTSAAHAIQRAAGTLHTPAAPLGG